MGSARSSRDAAYAAPVAAGRSSGSRRTVLDAADIDRALTRIGYEILERNKGAADVVLLGIPTRGVDLAERLAVRIGRVEGRPVPVGALDATMYRDDLRLRPARALAPTDIPDTGVDGRVVVLVDDVLYSGRTIRAALTALDDVGRPARVQLAVLVDRGHRQLPIRPDYVGKNLPTAPTESVQVRLTPRDDVDAVLLIRAGDPGRPADDDDRPAGDPGRRAEPTPEVHP